MYDTVFCLKSSELFTNAYSLMHNYFTGAEHKMMINFVINNKLCN